MSGFVARHPGGMEQIMMGAGRDVTQLFESYHSFDIYKSATKEITYTGHNDMCDFK